MKQTNLFNKRLNVNILKSSRSLVALVGVLGMIFVFGTQSSSAQTAMDLSEEQGHHLSMLVQGEMESLAYEMKYPVGSVETAYNNSLISYYRAVLDAFEDGDDFKVALTDGKTLSALSPNEGTIDDSMNSVGVKEVANLQVLVDALNLRDTDDSDLIAIFEFWRTLKNQ